MADYDSGSVRIKGLKAFTRNLAKVEPELKKKFLATSKKVAGFVVDKGKPKVPVRSGRLKRSLRPAANQRGAIIRAGNNGRVPYANPIHWGWPGRGIKGRRFVTATAWQTKDTWLPMYEAEAASVFNEYLDKKFE